MARTVLPTLSCLCKVANLEWPGIECGVFMVQKQTRCLRGQLQHRAS
jgi:hypothetical protein